MSTSRGFASSRRDKLTDVETDSVRRVLAVNPDGPWLVIVDKATWNVESRNTGADRPFATSRVGLLPLLERPREEVERQAGQALGPSDPDLIDVWHAVIKHALAGSSDYWISRALTWITPDEVGLYADVLKEIAVERSLAQATRHTAKRLLKASRHP